MKTGTASLSDEHSHTLTRRERLDRVRAALDTTDATPHQPPGTDFERSSGSAGYWKTREGGLIKVANGDTWAWCQVWEQGNAHRTLEFRDDDPDRIVAVLCTAGYVRAAADAQQPEQVPPLLFDLLRLAKQLDDACAEQDRRAEQLKKTQAALDLANVMRGQVRDDIRSLAQSWTRRGYGALAGELLAAFELDEDSEESPTPEPIVHDIDEPTRATRDAVHAALSTEQRTLEQRDLLAVYFDATCGDCMTGRCHGGGGQCGCARHEVSARWRDLRDARDGGEAT